MSELEWSGKTEKYHKFGEITNFFTRDSTG